MDEVKSFFDGLLCVVLRFGGGSEVNLPMGMLSLIIVLHFSGLGW